MDTNDIAILYNIHLPSSDCAEELCDTVHYIQTTEAKGEWGQLAGNGD